MIKTKIVFCTYPSLYSSVVLQRLLATPDIEVVGIVASTRVLKKSYGFMRGAWEMVRASGLRYVGYQMWATDLFHVLHSLSVHSPVKALAKERGIPILHTKDVNHATSLKFIASCKPDIIVSAYFNQLVKAPVLALPPLGCINIHPSLLPDYRGTDPIFAARARGEPRIGVTVHRVDEDFDTGSILRQQDVDAATGTAVLTHYVSLFDLGANLAVAAIAALREGDIGTPQPAGGSYSSWPTRNEVRAFRRSGNKLFSAHQYLKILQGTWPTRGVGLAAKPFLAP